MNGRIVEISGVSRHLSLSRGFLTIAEDSKEIGRVDLDTILSLIITSRGATVTNAVFTECAKRGIPVIICDNRYQPLSMMTPTHQHFDQNRRFHAQATATKGIRNRLWQAIVKGKITNQAAVLDSFGAPLVERLKRIASEVKAGDSANGEAHAAQIYWRALFGDDFRRDKDGDQLNELLNYGYAIIRAAMTKTILATGLHPTFGINHHNRSNPFCLADDLMEPYRPLVDQLVFMLKEKGEEYLTTETKRVLARIVIGDTISTQMVSPLGQQMGKLAYTVLDNIEGQKVTLALPRIFSPMELTTMINLNERC